MAFTLDPAELRLQLRDGIRREVQEFACGPCVVLEDPLNGRFFRVGEREAEFLALLDGKRTVREVIAAAASLRANGNSLTDNEASQVCHWLLQNGLAFHASKGMDVVGSSNSNAPPAAKQKSPGNPLSFRLTLFHPDRLLTSITPWLSWLMGPIGFVIWLATLLFAGLTLTDHWKLFTANVPQLLDPQRFWRMGLVFIGLKVVHELAHALACKRHGGRVGEVGVWMILFAPLPFVDVTSTWRFASKWHRIQVGAAGVYAELFIAALATLVWGYTFDATLRQTALEVMLLGSVATFVVNANPLMRFDGYYILSDLTGMPNLHSRGQQALYELGRRLLFGPQPNQHYPREWIWLVLYGMACFVWGQIVMLGMIVAAAMMWEGAGLLLAIAAAAAWYGLPAIRWLKAVTEPSNGVRSPRWRLAVAGGALLLLGIGIWNAPLPELWGEPGVVASEMEQVVRAATPGFVQEIKVRSGQTVRTGDVLMVLTNDELQTELADLELQLEAARINVRRSFNHQAIANAQAEAKLVEGLEKNIREMRRQVEELTVRAPVDGIVLAERLEEFRGTYLHPGSEIVTIDEVQRKEIHLALDQQAANVYRNMIGTQVSVTMRDIDSTNLTCEVVSVDPRGTTQLLHPALTALAGGPIVVRPTTTTTTSDDPEPSPTTQGWETVEPVFTARLRLTPTDSPHLPLGLRCRAHQNVYQQSIGTWLRNAFRQQVEKILFAGRKIESQNRTAQIGNNQRSSARVTGAPATGGIVLPT